MSALSQALETVTITCWIDVQRQPGSTEGPGPSIATDSSPTGPLSSFEPASGQVLWWTAVRHSLVRTVGWVHTSGSATKNQALRFCVVT